MKENYDLIIKALQAELKKFLSKNPHLQKYQQVIDKELALIGDDPFKRAIKLNEMLIQKMQQELFPAMNELRKIKSTVKHAANVLKDEDDKKAS